jgi:hypothetical protein
MLYITHMKTRYTVFRIWNDTLRKLRLAASLQPRRTSLIALMDRLVDEELQRLNATHLLPENPCDYEKNP